MPMNLAMPECGLDLSTQAQKVVDAALELSRDDQIGLLQVLESHLADLIENELPSRSREEFVAELQRRLDDYDSGRDPGFTEEEVAA